VAVKLLEDAGFVRTGSTIKVYSILAKHFWEPRSVKSVFWRIRPGFSLRPNVQQRAIDCLQHLYTHFWEELQNRSQLIERIKRLLVHSSTLDDYDESIRDEILGDQGPREIGSRLEGLDKYYTSLSAEQAMTLIHYDSLALMLQGEYNTDTEHNPQWTIAELGGHTLSVSQRHDIMAPELHGSNYTQPSDDTSQTTARPTLYSGQYSEDLV